MFGDISMGWVVVLHAAVLVVPLAIFLAELEWEDLHTRWRGPTHFGTVG